MPMLSHPKWCLHNANILLNFFATKMGEVSADSVTLDLLRDAWETVRSSPLGVINTPMIPWWQTTLPLHLRCNVHIKLENMQRTGKTKPLILLAHQLTAKELSYF